MVLALVVLNVAFPIVMTCHIVLLGGMQVSWGIGMDDEQEWP